MTTACPLPLKTFQDGFARALMAADAPASETPAIAALTSQPGFAVYRNTVMKGCIDALQANYPAVMRLVGEEWFRAAAAVFVRGNLPLEPALVRYGAGFADFLASFEPAAELPYLPGVARLDRFWTEAHIAPDEAPVAAADIARLAHEVLARTVLRPHASARWAWFADQPIYSIWRRSREPNGEDLSDLAWRAEGALIARPHGEVEWSALDAAGCAFLDTCAAGRPLGEAARAALAADAGADLSQLMARLLESGAFGNITTQDILKEDPA